MAMIINLGLPREDLERISEFMRTGGEGDSPSLNAKDSAKVLDELTGDSEGHPLWRPVIGQFVEYEDKTFYDSIMGRRDGFYVGPDGDHVSVVDALMDEGGKPTGKHGIVEEDYEDPEAAYVVGVPL